MKRVLYATCLLLLFVSYVDSHAFQSLKAEDMYECYVKLLCSLNREEDFHELLEEAGPEIKGNGWEWIKTVTGVEGPDNTLENWARYKAVVCDLSEEENRKQFNEFFQLGGEYWLEVCFNTYSPRCKKAEETATKVAEYFEIHFENGNCRKSAGNEQKTKKKVVFG
ncbi:uncharacterized protein LOC129956580 isoform X2 [Argiope bruennichi]|uniref:uncharacterized protein LOC129956580 isoform X2 n=1 Tax=Argiope bruennichi TaxID=94029 RepID=UPI002493DC5A|nr:uncharacterized protein LOC129956580 isoform X2 [Argiope bruennichi]